MPKGLLTTILMLPAVTLWSQDSKPTPTVAAYIMSWEMSNDACNNGDAQACRFREADEITINSQGWCLSQKEKWQAAPCVKPSEKVRQMMDAEEALNDRCRDGVKDAQGETDDVLTERVCSLRDAQLDRIKAAGWIWGHEGQSMSDRDWEPIPAK